MVTVQLKCSNGKNGRSYAMLASIPMVKLIWPSLFVVINQCEKKKLTKFQCVQWTQAISVRMEVTQYYGHHKYFYSLPNLFRASDNHCIPRSEFHIWMTTYKNQKRQHLLVSNFFRYQMKKLMELWSLAVLLKRWEKRREEIDGSPADFSYSFQNTAHPYEFLPHWPCKKFWKKLLSSKGFSMFMRMMAPALGYTLASMSLKMYISPSLTPTINDLDPRWLGAWWLGWIVLAVLLTPLTLFLGGWVLVLVE